MDLFRRDLGQGQLSQGAWRASFALPEAAGTDCADDEQFQDKAYQIRGTEGVQLVLPSNYVGELKALPEDVLSAREAIADVSTQTTLRAVQ